MCGLVGFSGHLPADPSKLKILLLENESRGGQSTGIYGKRMMKKNVTASKFIHDVNFDHIASSNAVIGHTRQPTSQNRDKQHAHPFMFGTPGSENFIVGAHNGSIFNEYELEQKIEGFTRCEVDSESIFKAMFMSKDPLKFMMCEGHMALTFIHNNLVYLYRRDSRPLFLGKTREGYYWSSLKEGLKKLSIPDQKIYDLRPGRLLILNGSRIIEKIEMPKPRVELDSWATSYNWDNKISNELREELTGKKYYPPVVHQETTQDTVNHRGDMSNQSSNSSTNTTTEEIPIYRAQEIPKVTRTRILSASDLKKIGVPRISGRNISLPLETKLTSREYSDHILGSIGSFNTLPHPYFNFFQKDVTSPFWLKDAGNLIVSDSVVYVQAAQKMEPCVTESTVVDINFLFYNRSFRTLNNVHRDQMFSFWKIGDYSSSQSKFDSDAIAYAPITKTRSYEENDGYFRIEIPKHALRSIRDKYKTLKICCLDAYSPMFAWDTLLRIEEDAYYKITVVMDILSEEEFIKGIPTKTLKTNLFDGVEGNNPASRIKNIYDRRIVLADKYNRVSIENQVKSRISRSLFKASSNLISEKSKISQEDKKKEIAKSLYLEWD